MERTGFDRDDWFRDSDGDPHAGLPGTRGIWVDREYVDSECAFCDNPATSWVCVAGSHIGDRMCEYDAAWRIATAPLTIDEWEVDAIEKAGISDDDDVAKLLASQAIGWVASRPYWAALIDAHKAGVA